MTSPPIALVSAAILLTLSGAARADDPVSGAAQSPGGPTIEVAPEHQKPPEPPAVAVGAGTVEDSKLVRGLSEQRGVRAEQSTTGTSVGGYAEAVVSGLQQGKNGEREWTADIPRLVLFVAHSFAKGVRFYSELEVEHAAGCAGCRGAVELEQAYVEAKLAGDSLGLRGGLVLMPMGIINQWHEPPIYLGAVRPRVETVVIPSTWRELGVGLFGTPRDWLRYEAYFVTGLDPAGFTSRGIGGGRQDGSLARANSWAGTARVEVEPLLGFVAGVSGYLSDAGANADVHAKDGDERSIDAPVLGWAADARWRRAGLEWKVLYAEWHLPESKQLMASFDEDGAPLVDAKSPVPTLVRGGYVELGYDVFHPFGLSHQIVPFARIERYDTQAAVPDGFAEDPSLRVTQLTFGAAYRPLQQVVVKVDYQLRYPTEGVDEGQLNFGLGCMY